MTKQALSSDTCVSLRRDKLSFDMMRTGNSGSPTQRQELRDDGRWHGLKDDVLYNVSCPNPRCEHYGYSWTVYGPIFKTAHACSVCWGPMDIERVP